LRLAEEDPRSAAAFPVQTKSGALPDSGIQIVFTRFSDRTQLLLTRTGKTGTVFQITRDASKEAQANKLVVSVDLLLGVESQERLLFARLLASSGSLERHLTAGRPCLLALGLQPQDLEDPQSLKTLTDAVGTFLGERP